MKTMKQLLTRLTMPVTVLGLSLSAGIASADTTVSINTSQTLTKDQVPADARFEFSNGAVLTLEVSSDLSIKGATGSGKLVKTGSAKLTFTNPESASDNQIDGGVEIEVQQGVVSVNDARLGTATVTLGADGGFDNWGWPTLNGTLTVNAEDNKTILNNSGNGNTSSLLGSGTFVKTGAGTLTVNSYFGINGSVQIEAGTLVFNRSMNTGRGRISGISGEGSYKLGYAGLADEIPAKYGLVHYLTFNGNENDQGLRPWNVGGQSATDGSRYEATDRGKAVQLSEESPQTAMYGDTAGLGEGDFTILARAKTQAQDKTVLFAFGQRGGGALGLRTDANGQVQFAAWKNGLTASSAYATMSDATTRYHFYALTYDNSAHKIRFYADGQLVGEPVDYTLDISGSQYQLGAIHGGVNAEDSVKSTECFLDELRAYRGAMTADEIAAFAQTYPVWPDGNTWKNTDGDFSWSNTANWSHGALPVTGEDIIIDIDGETTLAVPNSITLGNVIVSGEGTLAFTDTALSYAQLTISRESTVVYDITSETTFTTTIAGKGTLKKTGAGTLKLNNGSSGRLADGGVTIEIAGGKVLCNNGRGDPAFGDVRFVLGEADSAQLDNLGWMDFYGTVTLSSTTEKVVFANNGNNPSSVRQGGKIVKEGTGTILFKSRLNQTANVLEVNDGRFCLFVQQGWNYDCSGTVSGSGRFVKTGAGTLTLTSAQTLNGGIEVAEGKVVLSSGSDSVIYGVKGPGELTLSGNGALSLGRWKGDAANTASVTGSVITVERSTLRFGNGGVQDGSMLRDCTINFNGGNATAYGWITLNGTVVVNAAQDCTMTANANNRTQGSGTLVKRGTGTLQWNSHIDTAVTIEDGTLDKVSNTNFTIGDAVRVQIEGIEAKLTVPESKVLTNTGTSLEKYRVVRSVEEGVATYSLEKRGGFTVQIM